MTIFINFFKNKIDNKILNFANQFSRSKKISTPSYVIERFYGGVVWGTQGKQRGQSHLK